MPQGKELTTTHMAHCLPLQACTVSPCMRVLGHSHYGHNRDMCADTDKGFCTVASIKLVHIVWTSVTCIASV